MTRSPALRFVCLFLFALALHGCGSGDAGSTERAPTAAGNGENGIELSSVPTVQALAARGGLDTPPPAVTPEGAAVNAPSGPPPEVAAPYDDDADARADVDEALAAARADGKNVLLVFGANWCPWCRRLEHVLRNDPQVTRALTAGYRVVHVNTGPRGSGKNAELAAAYGDPVDLGLPALVVLRADGTIARTQETGSFEDGDHHVPARVAQFLDAIRREEAEQVN